MDLSLNNLQGSICHKTKLNQQGNIYFDLRWIELFEIEMFDHSTVCKQISDVYLSSYGKL